MPNKLIHAFGNRIYRTTAAAVGDLERTQDLVAELRHVQEKRKHCLVSAKHIGLDLRVFVIDLRFYRHESTAQNLVVVNPEILLQKAPLVSMLEDDLNAPGIQISIERSKFIELAFQDENLVSHKSQFSDSMARWILHGVDQLNGASFVERINVHRKRSIASQLKRIAEQKIETKYKLEYDLS